MSKMKYIMESVAIRLNDIVCKRIADEYTIPLQIASSTFSLIDFDLEMQGELLFIREVIVECWQR